MMRILILVGLAVAVLLLIRRFSRKSQQTPPPTPANRDTVQCAQCQTYIPKDEAVSMHGQYFCCPQHARDWKQPS